MKSSLAWATVAAATGLAVACAGPSGSPGASAAGDCTGLKGRLLGQRQATVTDAQLVPEAANVPAHCLVKVSLNDSKLRFESRLPTSGWNGKLAVLGGGGYKGLPFVPTLPFFSRSIVSERYATLATNGGYDYASRDAGYFEAKFAYDPVQLADFTYLSIHRSLPFGQELVRLFYGAPASKNYFEGCSAGGHEAMMLSQRFPADFDGIVARAPAGNFVGLFLQFNRFAKAQRAPGGSLNEAKQKLLANAVLARCDAQDGIADRLISKPAACDFDPASLRCPGGAEGGDACLSDAQILTVRTATTAWSTKDGRWGHGGVNWGAEDHRTKGWGEYLWPLAPAPFSGESLGKRFSDGFVRSFVVRDAAYDPQQFDPDQWLSSLSIVGSQFNAFSPDLSAFRARGGKLILWNGQHDTAVSPRETARYYDSVVRTMGQGAANETVELFLAPGVGHCFDGTGPDQVDLMKALVQWTEGGTPPSRQGVVMSKLDTAGKPLVTRPMCKHPSYARYNGSGDPNAAASFTCSTQ